MSKDKYPRIFSRQMEVIVYLRKELNFHRLSPQDWFGNQHDRHFIVLESKYGCRDVTRKRSLFKSFSQEKQQFVDML